MTGTLADIIPPASTPAPPGGTARAALRTARPRQWLKNVLVFAAPGAAGVLFHGHVLYRTLAAFGLFCVASAGTYFLNDVLDAAQDRRHPTKRLRPVASGQLPVPAAVGVAIGLMVVALGLSALLGPKFLVAMATYLVIPGVGYSLWLKHEPVFDIGAVAVGFIVRAVAGGLAAYVPLSDWFLIVASFGSLFMVVGKRYAEHLGLGVEAADHRSTLGRYTVAYLRYVGAVSSAVAIAGYCLWAFEKATPNGYTVHGAIWFQLSIAPFVLAILRYALVLESGGGGAPEDVVLGDRALQALGALWMLSFALGVYAL